MTPTPRDLEKAREWLFKHWPVLSPDGTPESIPIYRAITLAQLLADARAEEREACAEIARERPAHFIATGYCDNGSATAGFAKACGDIAQAIRARGDQ